LLPWPSPRARRNALTWIFRLASSTKVVWPGSGDQFLFADHLAGAFDQRGQDIERTAASRTG